MPLLSIIVPIYNVEEFLPRCVESILAQVFTDFELILINDGSPDRCDEIMEEFASKDKRIITIYQNNQGVSAARNAGLRIAQGKYVGFVDPDDWIEPLMYLKLLSVVEEADLAACGVKVITKKGVKSSIYRLPKNLNGKDRVKNELLSRFFDGNYSGLISVWSKIYKRAMLVENDLRFDDNLSRNEDGDFNYRVLQIASSFVYINEPLYNYNAIREGSLYKKINTNQYEIWKKNMIDKEIDCKKFGFRMDYNLFYTDFLYKSLFFCINLANIGRYDLIKSILEDDYYLTACRYKKNTKIPFNIYFYAVNRFNFGIKFIYWIWSGLKKIEGRRGNVCQ